MDSLKEELTMSAEKYVVERAQAPKSRGLFSRNKRPEPHVIGIPPEEQIRDLPASEDAPKQ